jgi:galactokinase
MLVGIHVKEGGIASVHRQHKHIRSSVDHPSGVSSVAAMILAIIMSLQGCASCDVSRRLK